MIGKVISHYKILEELGRGGMGTVYKAQDTKLDRFVALKFLPYHLSQDEENKKRFIHEAKAASALNHPNIATIYEIDETDGQMFIAMEYIEGQSLQQILDTNLAKVQNLRKVLDYAVQIAEGLAKAHSKDIIHRDIKPANILITEDSAVKIVDFGLAKLTGRTQLTKEGTSMGTVAYMSPEQTQGTEVDHRTDIWALGVVIYEMITGRQPFAGDYEQAVMYSIMNEDPEPPTALRTGVPIELERLVNKCLAKKLEERYQNLADLLVDLKALQKNLKEIVSTLHTATSKLVSPGWSKTSPSQRQNSLLLYGGIALIVSLSAFSIWKLLRPTPSSSKTIDSIAVLPLENLSNDPEQEYFADGMTETLISNLAQISALKVISRTSVMRFKDTKKSLPEIAAELRADVLVEGSVQRFENRVRIAAQLIDAATDQHLWAKSYERDLRDILSLQNEVAQAIAKEIQIKLTPQEQSRLANTRPVDPDAFEAYLKGLYLWDKRTPASLNKAIAYFEEASAKDPNFALSYRGLAACYNVLGIFFRAPKEVFPRGKLYTEKALEIDAMLAPPHVGLGIYHFYYAWDWLEAEKHFQRGLELDQKFGLGRNAYGSYLLAMGRPDEGIAEIKQALELDPLSLVINGDLGKAYYLARRFDEAIEQSQKTIELDPNYLNAYVPIAAAYEQKKMYKEAVSLLQKARDFSGDSPSVVAELGYAFAASGQHIEAQKILGELQERTTREYIAPDLIAFIYIALGEKDQAFMWLERAYDERSSQMVWLYVEPKFDPLRADARFIALTKKVGIRK